MVKKGQLDDTALIPSLSNSQNVDSALEKAYEGEFSLIPITPGHFVPNLFFP